MPEPNEDETREEFVSRCIPIVLEDGTAEDQEQAVAICNSMWEQGEEADMEEKAVWTTKYTNDLPDGSFLYVEPGDKDDEGKTVPRSKRHFPYKDASGKIDLPHLRNAIARIPQSNAPGLTAEKKKSLQERARRILAENQKEKGVFEWLKEKLFGEREPDEPIGGGGSSNDFTIWKEESGQTHWMAIYSNNYRDDDNPPEIISKEAHLDFVQAVDSGEWAMPELLYWHIPGARLGSTELVAFDVDSGMSLAAGTIDKGRESIIDAINQSPHQVSHGMPTREVQRDGDDPSIITRYRSKEISLLPVEATANPITMYMIKENEQMQIPEEKLKKAEELGFSREELEAKLQTGKEQAEREERESKELEAKEEEVTEAVEQVAEPEPEPGSEVEAPKSFTAEDVAEAVSAVIQPYLNEIKELKERVEMLSNPPEPEEQEEKQLDLTPAASLAALIKSAVIGKEEARVDGRVVRHDGPKETKAKTPETVRTSNELFNTTLNQILDPDGAWLEDLNLPRAD